MSNELTGSNLNESDVNLNRNQEPENTAMHLKRHVPKNISPEPRSLLDVEEIPPYKKPDQYGFSADSSKNTGYKPPSRHFLIFIGMAAIVVVSNVFASWSDSFGTQLLMFLVTLGAIIIGVPAVLISWSNQFVKPKDTDADEPSTFNFALGAAIHKFFPYVARGFLLLLIVLFLVSKLG